MNSHSGDKVIVLLGVALGALNAIQGLTTGQVMATRRLVRKTDNPRAFWLAIAASVAMAMVCLLAFLLA